MVACVTLRFTSTHVVCCAILCYAMLTCMVVHHLVADILHPAHRHTVIDGKQSCAGDDATGRGEGQTPLSELYQLYGWWLYPIVGHSISTMSSWLARPSASTLDMISKSSTMMEQALQGVLAESTTINISANRSRQTDMQRQ